MNAGDAAARAVTRLGGDRGGDVGRREHSTDEITLLAFEPGDVARLFEQDLVIEEYGQWPTLPFWWSDTGVLTYDPVRLRVIRRFDNNQLAQLVRDVRNARRLPLTPRFVRALTVLLGFVEAEARHRIAIVPRPGRDWRDADLVAEVAAVCGEGRFDGRQWWFHCPWHEDHTPSLHVRPGDNVWYAHCCARGGGVVAWRRATERRPA